MLDLVRRGAGRRMFVRLLCLRSESVFRPPLLDQHYVLGIEAKHRTGAG